MPMTAIPQIRNAGETFLNLCILQLSPDIGRDAELSGSQAAVTLDFLQHSNIDFPIDVSPDFIDMPLKFEPFSPLATDKSCGAVPVHQLSKCHRSSRKDPEMTG